MNRRLQVLFDEAEYREIQAFARCRQMSLAGWVREALRKVRADHAQGKVAKLRAIAEASQNQFPIADMDVILQEIDSGRLTR